MKVEATKDAMVQAFARAVEQAGGKAYLVGGLVRDELLGLPSKDFDFEVFGLPMEKVHEILKRFGNVKEVGQQFGVLNIQELDWDVALPRREKKTGEGHKGFDVVPDPTMTVEDAARRRDLTINALSKDPLTGQIIDPLGGIADLHQGILRAADPHTFGDDPLRALRVAQFAARFDFDVDPQTLEIVAAQPLEELPAERILPEFSKMLLKGKTPSKGIEVLRQANLLRYFPEIERLQGVQQDPEHHPEGDVYRHTLMVIDEAARERTGDPAFDLPLMLGALTHDFGKPDHTQVGEDGRIHSLGHEEGGVAPTREFLKRMKAPNDLTQQVETLVSNHLRPVLMPETAGRKGYRRLARKLESGNVSPELLAAVSKADTLGRKTEDSARRRTHVDKFLEEFHEHVTKSIEPGQQKLTDTVMGKDLIARGMKPGPDMGKFLALTRAIEDETGLTDADQIIDLATRFLESRSGEGESELKCGDSHIRPGETCYDGDYREMRKKGLTDSEVKAVQGPSGFREDPDKTEPDRVLWHEFDWPADEKSGEITHHPGLATAEPQRRHERSLTFQPKWFDSGTRFSERPLQGPGSRDGFGGSTPYNPDISKPNPIPEQEPHLDSVTPETGRPPGNFDWEMDGDIGPESREPFEGADEFPTGRWPQDKGAGYLAVELPLPQLLEDEEPHGSPMRAEEDSPGSSQPGKFMHYPGGGGLDRAPMQRPQGKPLGTGFLPVQNMPGPANMFKADLDSNFDQHELKLGIEDEMKNGADEKDAKEIAKERLTSDPRHYSDRARESLDTIPNKEKNQDKVEITEARPQFGRGGQDAGGLQMDRQHTSKQGGPGGDDKSREYWDMDRTGKKPGFMSIEPPKENIYPASQEDEADAARTREDLEEIETIFPKDYNPEWHPDGVSIGPSLKHRNERKVHDVGLDPFPYNNMEPDMVIDPSNASAEADDSNIEQKQVQPLMPNQKLAIAIDPKGVPGERIAILTPLFENVSPAIQALRSQKYEKRGAIVFDGPPEWLLSLNPKLEALDANGSMENAADLYQQVLELGPRSGLTVEYTQEPRP
jgi:tRNA nucleotidyltransferase (CCA-adding enzyme)